jgi:transposase
VRSEAAKIGGVTLQDVRDWVLRFNAQGPDGLFDRKALGAVSLMKNAHRATLARVVDLCQWLFEEFRLSVSETTMSRELRKMGYRKLSARPRHHAQREGTFFRGIQKNFPTRLEEIARKKGAFARMTLLQILSALQKAKARQSGLKAFWSLLIGPPKN